MISGFLCFHDLYIFFIIGNKILLIQRKMSIGVLIDSLTEIGMLKP